MQVSESMNHYFESIDIELKKAYELAGKARSKGFDPDDFVSIPLAKNMAERVEGLISVVAPQIKDKGMTDKILKLEQEHGVQSPIVAFLLSEAVAKREFCEFKDEREAIEIGLRAGLAYLTNGVVASPLEGFIRLELKNRMDGKGKFFSLFFGGPIRSAGTTATCYFVACCDYVRRQMGYLPYDPTNDEVKRSYAEMDFYHSRITNLQYMPSEPEVEFITSNLPVQIEGDGSEKLETPNYKDLPRVSTNKLRNGFCLVMGESLALKWKKFWGKFSKFYEKVGMNDWIFVDQFVKLQSDIRSKSKGGEVKKSDLKVVPDYGFIKDLVAGRPVLGYPLRSGAFRLRYGRARTSGFSVDALHPATLIVLDGYISTGTQIKPERPGKGATISVCDRIEGPRVKLKNGDVIFVDSEAQARELNKNVEEILYAGDVLINYGDFLDRGHVLVSPGYCEEWWTAELEKKGKIVDPFVSLNFLDSYKISLENDVPLYPRFTYFWKEIKYNDLISLIEWIKVGSISEDKIILPLEGDLLLKRIIEILGIPHKCVGNEYIIIEGDWFNSLKISLGFYSKPFNYELLIEKHKEFTDVLSFINSVSELRVKDKSGVFIGSRMARPEKGKMRELAGSPHCLFPIGNEGGRLRSFQSALDKGKVRAQFSLLFCNKCNKNVYYNHCPTCGSVAVKKWKCNQCGLLDSKCDKEGHRCDCYDNLDLNIREEYGISLKRLGLGSGPELVKGVRGTSNKEHIPEPLEKGILRALHKISVNKDGTTRYDMTEMTVTHFKPREIGVSLEKLRSLGYLKDVYGNDLTSNDQILELKCQDIILPACLDSPDEGADFILTRVANFLDDLLVKFYGVEPYYNIKTREDLVGQLVIGLSPHTCAGIVARIVGFSKQQGLWAHPYLHSAMRRDCLYPSTKLLVNNQYLEIGNYVENLISKGAKTRVIDFVGTKRIDCGDNLFTYGLLGNKLVKKKIKYFIKGPLEQKWIKITTATNKELIMTENHKFLYFEDSFKVKNASEIKVEDKIPIVANFKPDIKETEFNVLNLFLENLPEKELKKLRLRGASAFFKELVKECNLKIKNSFKWCNSVPLLDIKKLVSDGFVLIIPKEAYIATLFSNYKFSLKLKVTKELMRILGYYISEGYSRESKTVNQVAFRICNKEMQKDLVYCINKAFNCKVNLGEENTKITIGHKAIYYLLVYCLGIGKGAYNKRIPHFVYNLKNEYVYEFISAYLDGDGTIVKNRNFIVFYSVSRSLLDDFGLLLSRYGLVGRYLRTNERLPGRKVLERYESLNKKPKTHVLNHLVYSGKDLLFFKKNLNLKNKFKIDKLASLKDEYLERRLCFNGKNCKLEINGDYYLDYVKKVEIIEDKKHSYCLEVEGDKLEDKSIIWSEQIINLRCDGDEAGIMLLMDALLNFSRKLLSDHRGATQDEPLVLASVLLPKEVDDMVFNMDTVFKYPLEFYEAAEQYKYATDVKIETVRDRLDKESQYEGFGFTHDTFDINAGITCSSYKTIPTMKEKVEGQMTIARKMRCVDHDDVARLTIERHFMRDIKGNLRKFSMQQFRCVDCNEKYRRPPLRGICKCGGKLLFTISEGSVIKYLEPSMQLSRDYNLPPFLKQSLELLQQSVDMVFGKEKEKQEGLGKFFCAK